MGLLHSTIVSAITADVTDPANWIPSKDEGLAIAILAIITFGLWRIVKWLGGLFQSAILEPDGGLLSLAQRHVSNTEKFLHDASARDEKQQELCQLHAENLADHSKILAATEIISRDIHTDLVKFREEAADPYAPFSTVQTNQAIVYACEALVEVAREHAPAVAPDVGRHCDIIKGFFDKQDA